MTTHSRQYLFYTQKEPTMKKIALTAASVLALSACGGVVSTPKATVTAPAPTVTVTEAPSYSSDDMSTGEMALALAWADMPSSSQQTICESYNTSPSYAWSVWQDTDDSNLITRSEFYDFFDSVC